MTFFSYLRVLVALCIFAAGLPAYSASVIGSMTADVVPPPLTFTSDSSRILRFGRFSSGDTSGSIKVDQAGARTATGGVTLLPSSDVGAARFELNGLRDSTVFLTGSKNFVTTGVAALSGVVDYPASVSLNNSGFAEFFMGATMEVPANTPPGNIEFAVNITANY